MKKKLLALLLVAAMVLATLPSSIFAGDELQVKKSDGSAAVLGVDYMVYGGTYALSADGLTVEGGTGTETVTITDAVYSFVLRDTNIFGTSVDGNGDLKIVAEGTNISKRFQVFNDGTITLSGTGKLKASDPDQSYFIECDGDLICESGEYSYIGAVVYIWANQLKFADGAKFYGAVQNQSGSTVTLGANQGISGANINASAQVLPAQSVITKATIAKGQVLAGSEAPKSVAVGYSSISADSEKVEEKEAPSGWAQNNTTATAITDQNSGVQPIFNVMTEAEVRAAVPLTEAEQKAIKDGKGLSIVATGGVAELTDTEATEEIQKEAGTKKVAYYLDYSLTKQVEGFDAVEIHETNAGTTIKVQFVLPDDVRQQVTEVSDISIIRWHDGDATKIEPTNYDKETGKVTFESNQFSIFGVAVTTNPNTGVEGSGLWAVLALIACAVTLIAVKKRSSVQ